ncbi:MAG: protein translocase subunit SecF [Treponema sp.]|nr:protein translocase subunit SecF [Treponema sp.]
MAKKCIHFSKAFLPCAIISIALILFGIAGFFIKGINFGLDYRPGLLEEVRIAPTVLDVTYSGSSNVTLNLTNTQVEAVISGTGAENETRSFLFSENETVASLAASLNTIDGVSAVVNGAYGNTSSSALFTNSMLSNRLSAVPYRLYASGQTVVEVSEVRDALSSLGGISVQQLGTGADASFQIRMADKGAGASGADLQDTILQILENKFGADNVSVVRTDFIGSSFSRSIALQSVLLLGGAILLIWLYATIRFHWDFALGSIIALIHDALIMMTFIVWTQLEFSTMIVAAVLTIIGYSINATIVILDRERTLLPLMSDIKKFSDIIDYALTDTLSRSIITTATTMFAALSLYVFTSGNIKNFALALIVGLVSGCYSSMFISSGFIAATRKNWKSEYGIHHSLKTKAGVFDAGVSV